VRTIVAFALFACALLPGGLRAQPYPGLTPVPRTTDPAVQHSLTIEREISERIRLGIEAETRRDFGAAVTQFDRALALTPHEPQASTAFYDRGLAQAGLGDDPAAADSFREAVRRDPGFLAARANLVAVEIVAGDLAGARAAADAFVREAPESARALYGRGLVALRSGDTATARDDFKKLLAADPAYAVAHYDLALVEQRDGHYDEAERELRAALGLSSGYVRARLALGAVLLHEGKRMEARDAFDTVTQAPGTDPTLRNLAVSLRDAIAVTP
jgi:Tfp pilus assembly protein PilF